VERSKRVKMNRPGGKQPAEGGIRPLWGRLQLEIKAQILVLTTGRLRRKKKACKTGITFR